jgi:hypothetical protein
MIAAAVRTRFHIVKIRQKRLVDAISIINGSIVNAVVIWCVEDATVTLCSHGG